MPQLSPPLHHPDGNPLRGRPLPPDVIALAVRWYLRFRLSDADVAALLAERGIDVGAPAIYGRVREFAPLYEDAARPFRRSVGSTWRVDGTSASVVSTPVYVSRAIDASERRAATDAATFSRLPPRDRGHRGRPGRSHDRLCRRLPARAGRGAPERAARDGQGGPAADRARPPAPQGAATPAARLRDAGRGHDAVRRTCLPAQPAWRFLRLRAGGRCRVRRDEATGSTSVGRPDGCPAGVVTPVTTGVARSGCSGALLHLAIPAQPNSIRARAHQLGRAKLLCVRRAPATRRPRRRRASRPSRYNPSGERFQPVAKAVASRDGAAPTRLPRYTTNRQRCRT